VEPTLASPSRRCALFAKAPVPGQVKTRLCPPLTPSQAAALQEAMLLDVAERLAAVREFRTEILFAPPAAEAWFRARMPPACTLRAQEGEGLGERLARCSQALLSSSHPGTLVIVGSDHPLLASATVLQAFARLEAGADLVLGPDAGGGYYLIGLRAAQPWIFREVPMSSEQMYAATCRLARARGLTLVELEPGYDIDLPGDLERLRRELRDLDPSSERFPARTQRWLSS
jgi:hypothetical protein